MLAVFLILDSSHCLRLGLSPNLKLDNSERESLSLLQAFMCVPKI